MSCILFRRLFALAVFVWGASGVLADVSAQVPVFTINDVEAGEDPFPDDPLPDDPLPDDPFPDDQLPVEAVQDTGLASDFDSNCGCHSASCTGNCGGTSARNWAKADYLHWWTKGNRIPALVTSSPDGTMQTDAGILGVTGTRTLFGGGAIADEGRSGLRITVGHWLDDCQQDGIEATYFSVFNDEATDGFSGQTTGGAGSGSPILARPFFDVNANLENARLSSYVGVADGSITVSSSSEFHSAGLLLRHHLRSGTRGRIDLLGGYRYFRFREALRIDENFVSTGAGGGIAVGTAIDVYDLFETENDFHGGELGLAATFDRDCWSLDLLAKLAIGNIHRTVNINGQTTTTTPAPGSTTSSAAGGLLALSSNIDQRSYNDLAILPEFGANLAYDLNDCLQLRAGYSLLILNNVARTGEQMNRSINPNLIPGGSGAGPLAPASPSNQASDFWAHGINFGVSGKF